MALFGYDRAAVDELVQDGSRIMQEQASQIAGLAAENRRLREAAAASAESHREQLREREGSSTAKTRELRETIRRLEAQVVDLTERVEMAEAERDDAVVDRDDADEARVEAGRVIAKLEAREAAWREERDEFRDDLRDRDARLSELSEAMRQRDLHLAETMGVIRGLTATHAAREGGAGPSGPVAGADRKAIMRGQAALARGAKTGLSDDARRRALREAKAVLGELPPALDADLDGLEAADEDPADAEPPKHSRTQK